MKITQEMIERELPPWQNPKSAMHRAAQEAAANLLRESKDGRIISFGNPESYFDPLGLKSEKP